MLKVDARLRKPRYEKPVGSYVFLKKKKGIAVKHRYTLARVATGTYQFTKVNSDTFFVDRKGEWERVSCDRVELVPIPMDVVDGASLTEYLETIRITPIPKRAEELIDQSATRATQGKVKRGTIIRTPTVSIHMGAGQISLGMGSVMRESGPTLQKGDESDEDDTPSVMPHGREDEGEKVSSDDTRLNKVPDQGA